MRTVLRTLLVLLCTTCLVSARAATVAEVSEISRDAARLNPSVCVTGVVTIAFSWIGLSGVIADPADPNGPSVYCSGRMPELPAAEAIGFKTLETGDVIEIRGFMASMLVDPGIIAKEMTKVGHMELPPPPVRDYAYLKTTQCYNRRACLRGVVRSLRHRRIHQIESTVLSLETEDGVVPVSIHNADPSWARFLDEEVTVDGVLLPCITMGWEALYPELEMTGEDPIRPVDPWSRFLRLTGRMLRILGIVALVPLVAAVVALFIQKRRERDRARVVAEDRRRIAAELHDTVAQYLSGTKILLTSVRAAESTLDPAVRETVSAACDMLDQTRLEVRAAINDLRSDDLLMKPLDKLLAAYAERLETMGTVKARAETRDLPSNLSPEHKRDILGIVQEASMNAIRHGGAKEVVITAFEDLRGLTILVANDGAPFDPGLAAGPEQGHYGISGMRERANRLGLELDFTTTDGRPTLRLQSKA